MQPDDEEKFLHDKLISARTELAEIKKAVRALEGKRNVAEKYLAEVEGACKDYMEGNGIIESECFRLKTTEVVDAPDVAAIPSEYLRIKVIPEPDKRKIALDRPAGANWYSMVENKHIMLRSE